MNGILVSQIGQSMQQGIHQTEIIGDIFCVVVRGDLKD